jgi:hypothetical protein
MSHYSFNATWSQFQTGNELVGTGECSVHGMAVVVGVVDGGGHSARTSASTINISSNTTGTAGSGGGVVLFRLGGGTVDGLFRPGLHAVTPITISFY